MKKLLVFLTMFVISALLTIDAQADRLWQVTPTGDTSIVSSNLVDGMMDIVVDNMGTVFLLDARATDLNTSNIWEVGQDGSTSLIASVQASRGFTLGPDDAFYLAMMGGSNPGGTYFPNISRVTKEGDVSVFFDPELPSTQSFLDVKFDSAGDLLVLNTVESSPTLPSNPREILKLSNGQLSTFVNPELVGGQALRLAIESNDNLFVTSGQWQSGFPNGEIQVVDPIGDITSFATLPPSPGYSYNVTTDIDIFQEDVYISDISGNVFKVDESGQQTIYASGLGRALALSFDNTGNLFVLDFTDTGGGGGETPIPEPATFFLLGSGLIGLAGTRKKFKK